MGLWKKGKAKYAKAQAAFKDFEDKQQKRQMANVKVQQERWTKKAALEKERRKLDKLKAQARPPQRKPVSHGSQGGIQMDPFGGVGMGGGFGIAPPRKKNNRRPPSIFDGL
ncbi:MAG: hypothetical protein DRR04_05325 [Gammaproteobacteria bacterium]|nr:MAG: hypothetical protein DRQ97_06745 [Gammaproteobacteria bacterium]RLA60549.1 MAG: hypothetical protein DRR04_05325 [Gammaproteobacteria bacterium]